jgi:hypothetical protein
MEEFEEIDYKSITNDRKRLEKLTSDRYWNEFKGDWKSYMEDAFKWDDEPKSVDKPFRVKIEIKEKPHPFHNWIQKETPTN